jgi:L-rhamnose-H+ transport protein
LLASIIMYGIGAEGLGAWGASTGWAINMNTTIFAANAWGLITGQWRNASRKSYVLLAIGLAAITIAIVLASPTSSVS